MDGLSIVSDTDTLYFVSVLLLFFLNLCIILVLSSSWFQHPQTDSELKVQTCPTAIVTSTALLVNLL